MIDVKKAFSVNVNNANFFDLPDYKYNDLTKSDDINVNPNFYSALMSKFQTIKNDTLEFFSIIEAQYKDIYDKHFAEVKEKVVYNFADYRGRFILLNALNGYMNLVHFFNEMRNTLCELRKTNKDLYSHITYFSKMNLNVKDINNFIFLKVYPNLQEELLAIDTQTCKILNEEIQQPLLAFTGDYYIYTEDSWFNSIVVRDNQPKAKKTVEMKVNVDSPKPKKEKAIKEGNQVKVVEKEIIQTPVEVKVEEIVQKVEVSDNQKTMITENGVYFEGVFYDSEAKLYKAFNVPGSTYRTRKQRNWTLTERIYGKQNS